MTNRSLKPFCSSSKMHGHLLFRGSKEAEIPGKGNNLLLGLCIGCSCFLECPSLISTLFLLSLLSDL